MMKRSHWGRQGAFQGRVGGSAGGEAAAAAGLAAAVGGRQVHGVGPRTMLGTALESWGRTRRTCGRRAEGSRTADRDDRARENEEP